MKQYTKGERVLVNSALAFGTVVEVERTRTGLRYTVEMSDGYRLSRYDTGLT